MSLARRLLHAVLIVLTLIVGATAAAVIVTQTAWFKQWLRGYIVREADHYLNGDLTIGRLSGNLFFGVELEDVDISLNGADVVSVDDLGVRYNLFQLVTQGLSIDEVRLTRPTIHLTRDGDTWTLARLVKEQAQEADREGPGSPIVVDAIGISDATLVIDDDAFAAAAPVGTAGTAAIAGKGESAVDVPTRVERIDARLSFAYEPVRYSVAIDHLSFRTVAPQFALNALSGGIAVDDDTVYLEQVELRTAESSVSIAGAVRQYLTTPVFNLTVTSDTFSVPEVARLVPALAGVRLQPAFELAVEGALDRLGVTMNVRSAAGRVTGTLVADLVEPGQAVKGELRIGGLDLSAVLPDQPRTHLTAGVTADLRSPEALSDVQGLIGNVTLQTDRIEGAGYVVDRARVDATLDRGALTVEADARAYGIDVTAAGRATLPPGNPPRGRLSYDVSGAVRRINLRHLPPSVAVPRVETDLNVRYRARGEESLVAAESGGTPARSVTADLSFESSTVPGAVLADGGTAQVTLRGDDLSYAADATVRDADLVELGRAFDVAALQDEQYRSRLNLRLQAEGSGTELAVLDLRAAGEMSDSTIMGSRIPALSFTATVADDAAHVTASGQMAEVNPATVSGNQQIAGDVAGALDVDVTVSGLSGGVTADTITGAGRLTLAPSTVGGLAIERASADVSYRPRTADIRSLEVVGRDLNVTADGTLALDDAGQSNLRVHADTPRLRTLGALFDVPVDGIARVDATVTGNRTALQATGTLTGNGVKYNDNGALASTSTFSVRVPDLAAERASADVQTSATFVTVAGQNVNELTVQAAYDQREVTFEGTAEQPDRSLSAGGSLSLAPEQQELRLRSFGLQSRGVQLGLAPGADARIRYGGEVVEVNDLRLTSGTAELSVDGAFGSPDGALTVTIANADLATVDALLLREPQLSGRFAATSTITGTREAPRVEGQFAVDDGGFRQFRYESLRGTVAYEPTGITLDARLQQNPMQWLTAKGFVPTAVFSSSDASGADGGSAPAADAPIDVTIDSSPVDLGLVQGFTTAVTGVTGVAEAHIRVTGTAALPEPAGRVTIQNGALTVVPTGTEYRNISAAVQLQPDRVHIDQVTVLDSRNNAMSLTGDVAIDARRVSGVQLYVDASNFQIVDNELGDLRLQSSLGIGGDLRAPFVGGYLSIAGDVNLDNVIAVAGTSPYPTAPADGSDEATPEEATATTGPYAESTIDVTLSIPDALVVKGDNLQPPGSPVGLGALLLTLGGDLRATKKPGDTIRLVGSVNTVRGTYDFQGRRFEILRDGAIRFVGLEELNPTLDLRTQRTIQGVEARVNIRGTLTKPEIELSSTPPLEQADVLSLIVFNQPLNQLGEGQQTSLAARAQALATGAVAGQLAQSIGNALNLDTFEIQVAPEAGGGPQVTLGQQVGDRLFVRVQQGIGDQSTTNLVLEYELANWLRLQTKVVQGSTTQQSLFRRNQSTGADMIFFFSY